MARREPTAIASADVAEDLEHARELAETSLAANTRRAYRADIADWKVYATKVGVSVVPADPVAVVAYISNMDRKRNLSRATIRRRCAALAYLHREKDLANPMEDPGVQKVMRGLVRSRTEPQTKKHPLTPEILRLVLDHPRTSVRDRALLLLGIVIGVRRSELVALRWGDITNHPQGVVVEIRTSKTDQKGRGRLVSVPRHADPVVCPVRALEQWRAESQDKKLVFPFSAQTVSDRVKAAARLAGADPNLFGGHSLRAGLMTIAAEQGISLPMSMGQSGHVNHNVASAYVRTATAFSNTTPFAILDALAKAVSDPTTPKSSRVVKKKGSA